MVKEDDAKGIAGDEHESADDDGLGGIVKVRGF